MSQFSEEEIFNYLDGSSSEEQKRAFQQALSDDAAFKAYFEQFKAIEESLISMPLEKTPDGMSDRVMEQVKSLPQTAYYHNTSIFSGTRFLIISGVLTALVAIISLFNSGYLSVESLETTAQGYQLLEEWTVVKGFFSQKMLTNAMLVIFGVLSLGILDRVILHPLFKKKMSGSF